MILIVDDKAENIFSLSRTLELHGFEVDAASSGEEALKKILKHQYSLIILDVQMPGMDGFEVADAISGFSKASDIPIIFLSAVNTDKKFITRGYTSGGVDYITKPVDPDIFMLKVKTLHRLSEQNRELKEIRSALLEEVQIRKVAEAELNRKVTELYSILEAIPQIAFTLNGHGEIGYVNERGSLYAAGPCMLPVFHPEDEPSIRQKWDAALRSRSLLESEVRIAEPDRITYRYYLIRMIPVKAGDSVSMWVGTFTDIDGQKSTNLLLESKVADRTRELLQKNKELEDSNYELQQFASVASHDLKEPLRKIQLCSSVLRENVLLSDTPELKLNIERIISSASRMNMLINDLIDHSRLSIDTLFEQVDLDHIVGEVLSDLELSIQEKRAILLLDKLPLMQAIPGQMRQVFQNLISNSLKFSQKHIPPEIRVQADRVALQAPDAPADPDGPFIRIHIRDNGIGFDEQYLDKVFTIFQRLNPRDAYEGTGIGLAIVKKIVEKHRGIIIGRSHEGNGASFIMVLPLQQMTGIPEYTNHQYKPVE